MAYTVDSAAKDSNGLFVFDLKNGKVNPIENDAKIYNRLTWSEDGTALAVLKGLDVEKMRERDNQLIVYANVQAAMGDAAPAPVRLDPAKAEGFPKGWVVSDRAALAWSDDNKRVFFSTKDQVPAPDAAARVDSRSEDEPQMMRRKRRLGGGRELLHLAQSPEHSELTQSARRRLQPQPLEKIQQRPRHAERRARFQHVHEHEAAHAAGEPSARAAHFDFRARIFHHAPVTHSRRTCRFASAARQAQVDVLLIGLCDGRSGGHLHHLVNPSARRIHFQAQHTVRGARVQTQPAMHAAVQVELARAKRGLFRYGGRVFHGLTGCLGRKDV
jgi:hypothetical protein